MATLVRHLPDGTEETYAVYDTLEAAGGADKSFVINVGGSDKYVSLTDTDTGRNLKFKKKVGDSLVDYFVNPSLITNYTITINQKANQTIHVWTGDTYETDHTATFTAPANTKYKVTVEGAEGYNPGDVTITPPPVTENISQGKLILEKGISKANPNGIILYGLLRKKITVLGPSDAKESLGYGMCGSIKPDTFSLQNGNILFGFIKQPTFLSDGSYEDDSYCGKIKYENNAAIFKFFIQPKDNSTNKDLILTKISFAIGTTEFNMPDNSTSKAINVIDTNYYEIELNFNSLSEEQQAVFADINLGKELLFKVANLQYTMNKE